MANNPFTVITNINVRLTVKEKTDGGIGTVSATSAGVFVPFNKTFLDVRSIVVSGKKQAGFDVIGIWDFGTEADGGFTAYLLRRDTGAYVNGDFGWTARGV